MLIMAKKGQSFPKLKIEKNCEKNTKTLANVSDWSQSAQLIWPPKCFEQTPALGGQQALLVVRRELQ